jgi:hypothetical protein
MLRALSLTFLMTITAPASAAEIPDADASIVAQQKQPPQQQAPRRDCEKRQEGIS